LTRFKALLHYSVEPEIVSKQNTVSACSGDPAKPPGAAAGSKAANEIRACMDSSVVAAAEAEEAEGATDAAAGEYREVLKIDPNHPNIHFRIGRTLLAGAQAKGDGADVIEAATEFEQELQLDPSNANAAYELAEIHRKAGQLEYAQKYFEIAVANYPTSKRHTSVLLLL
jgi:tetratricopeptide (TPR) repeat protein